MFNLGVSEIFVIIAAALLLVRPGDMSVLARKAGQVMGTIKRYRDLLASEMDSLKAGEGEAHNSVPEDSRSESGDKTG